MILPVGAWVIRAACQQLAAWDRLGLPPMRLAVNLSARQFRHLYLASLIEDSLRENTIEPRRLEIELTESLLMEDNETTRAMLENFRRLGVRLAIDDFGTGHSSLQLHQALHHRHVEDRPLVRAVAAGQRRGRGHRGGGHRARPQHEDVRRRRRRRDAGAGAGAARTRLRRDAGLSGSAGRCRAGTSLAWMVNHNRSRPRRRSRGRYSDTYADTGPITLVLAERGRAAR